MKLKCFLILFFALAFAIDSRAQNQIQKITVTAGGLTCSLCSKAIYKALTVLPFAENVEVDLQGSKYVIACKKNVLFDIGQVARAVQHAGYSVVELQVLAVLNPTTAHPHELIQIQGNRFVVLDVKDITLEGAHTFTVRDKAYLLPSAYRRYQKQINGEAAGSSTEPIYHVSLM